jgi:hypothetical protein
MLIEAQLELLKNDEWDKLAEPFHAEEAIGTSKA